MNTHAQNHREAIAEEHRRRTTEVQVRNLGRPVNASDDAEQVPWISVGILAASHCMAFCMGAVACIGFILTS